MDEVRQRRPHFVRTAGLGIFVVGGMIALVIATSLHVRDLDAIVILAFPLGYWLMGQGVLIVAVIAAFWFAARQERIDRTHGVTDEI